MTTQQPVLVNRARWTPEEFEHLAELGAFADRKMELIEGEIIEKMTQNEPHAIALSLTAWSLGEIFGVGYYIRQQMPMRLENSKPEPDICVVEGAMRDYLASHPTTAVLVVEISDTTLIPDQQTKAALYARAGIEEYWIVNLNERTLEVRRQSAPMTEALLGFGYRSTQILLPGESVSPLAAPQSVIRVDDLLP